MATKVRAQMASARVPIRLQKCGVDPRHWFSPITPDGRVVDAPTTRCVDFYGHILLWPPKNAHEWSVHAAQLGCRNLRRTPDIGLHPPHPLVASWTHALPGVWTSMATYCYGHPSTRTNGQCTRPDWDAETLGGPPTLVCTHHTRWSRRGRSPFPVCGLLWPHTATATQVRARMASARVPIGMQKRSEDPRHWFAPTTPAGRVVDARPSRCVDFYGHILLWPPKYAHKWPVQAFLLGCRSVWRTPGFDFHPPLRLVALWTHALPGVWTSMATYCCGHPSTRTYGQCTRGPVGMQKCGVDPRHWFAPATPAGRVVDARTTRCVDFYGHILLWPPKNAHEWPVQASRLGRRTARRTPDIGLHPPHPLVASWTHALPGVWTCMATYCYGHPSTRRNGQCTRPGWVAGMFGGPPGLGFTLNTSWSRRGRTHYPVCGLLWPHTSMATQERARIVSARGPVGMQKCGVDPRHWFAPTTPAGRVVDARSSRCVDFYGHILLWPPKNAHECSVHAARLGCRNVSGTPDIGLHPPHPLVASWTHSLLGVWTSMATYCYGYPSTRTNGQCTRPDWDAETLGGPPTLVCTHHTRCSRRGRTHFPVCGLLWPHTSMGTQGRARMVSARGPVGMQKCLGDPRHWFAPTSRAARVVDATKEPIESSGKRGAQGLRRSNRSLYGLEAHIGAGTLVPFLWCQSISQSEA